MICKMALGPRDGRSRDVSADSLLLPAQRLPVFLKCASVVVVRVTNRPPRNRSYNWERHRDSCPPNAGAGFPRGLPSDRTRPRASTRHRPPSARTAAASRRLLRRGARPRSGACASSDAGLRSTSGCHGRIQSSRPDSSPSSVKLTSGANASPRAIATLRISFALPIRFDARSLNQSGPKRSSSLRST